MSAERISSMDEMVKAINNFINASKKFISDKGYDAKLTEIMMNATDPEDVFTAEQLVRVLSVVDNMTVVLDYLSKPVRIRGKIRVMKKEVWLDDTKLKNGDKIEYMMDGKWKAAIFKYNEEKGTASLLGDDQKIYDVQLIDKLDGRMR